MYVDEAGKRDPNQKDPCFCFAVIAIPGDKKEFSRDETKMKIMKGTRAKKKDILRTKNLIFNHNGFINVTYFDFSSDDTVKAAIDRYKARKKTSKLELKKMSSLSNYIWCIALPIVIFNTIFDILMNGQLVNTVSIKYHNYPLSPRETKLIEGLGLTLIREKVLEGCVGINKYARRPYLKGSDIEILGITACSDKDMWIKIADQTVSGFRRFYIRGASKDFENIFEKSRISIKNKTRVFKKDA